MKHIEDSLQPPEIIQKVFEEMADIRINGNRPWDMRVHDPEVYRRILSQGSLGFGEAYMDGLWDCPEPDQLFNRLFSIEDITSRFSGRLLFRLAFQNKHQIGQSPWM